MSLRIGDFVNPAMSVLSLNKATAQTQKALSRLSSGSRIVETSDDAAGAAVALKLEASINRSLATQINLQNADSFLRTQASALDALGKGVTRLMELKTLSLDTTKNFSDIVNYSVEFSELRKSLVDISNTKFNGIDLFSHTGSDTYLNLASDENGQQQVRLTQYALGVGVTEWLSDNSTFSFIPGALSWEQAKADAESRGGNLATIETDAKWADIVAALGATASSWLWAGASQVAGSAEPIGGWNWINGVPIDWNEAHANVADDRSGNGFGTQSYLRVRNQGGFCAWDDLANADAYNSITGYILETPSRDLTTVQSSTLEKTLQYISNSLANCGSEATSVGVSCDNIRIKTVNLESAKSKITDTDIARETLSLSKAQILSQIITMLIKQGIDNQKVLSTLVDQR